MALMTISETNDSCRTLTASVSSLRLVIDYPIYAFD